MKITFGFEVIGTEMVDIDIDDEEIAGMSDGEILDYAQDNYWTKAERKAERDCDYSIGQLESVTFNDEEHWVGC